MGYATVGNDSFLLEPERFTGSEVNRTAVPFSRRRDFTVPFSKPLWAHDYALDTTRTLERLLNQEKPLEKALMSIQVMEILGENRCQLPSVLRIQDWPVLVSSFITSDPSATI
jgi:hypothetical protein